VAVRYRDPSRLAVELWRGNDILVNQPCADAAEVTREADRLFNKWCQATEPA
jgi:hypothetical protein